MASDDAVYGLLLVLAIPFGYLLRSIANPSVRELVCASAGFGTVLIICKWHIVHFVLVTGVSVPLILLLPRSYVHKVTFLWCFGYLVFFRTCHHFGMQMPSGHSNAVQMLLTLKLVGLACELNVTEALQRKYSLHMLSAEDKRLAHLHLKSRRVQPNVLSVLSYSFCYIGLLTGPFYKYKTYVDMLDSKSASSSLTPIMDRLHSLLATGLLFLLLSQVTNVSYVDTDEFYEKPAWWRLGYVCLLFAWYRARMYSAWLLAECTCITASLGAYPAVQQARSGEGPTVFDHPSDDHDQTNAETQWDFETIRSIDAWKVESCATFKETLRSWNQTVQWWLAANVYSNIHSKNKMFRTSVLMAVSAFWHGVYPGYYLTFLSIPPVLFAEECVQRAVRSRLQPHGQQTYDRVAAFVRMRYFEYISVGPLLLRVDAVWRYWQSMYFAGHVAIVLAAFLGWYFSKAVTSRRMDSKVHNAGHLATSDSDK